MNAGNVAESAFFACAKGCTGCCPGGTYTIEASRFPSYYSKVHSTIGDLWRAYKFHNPEGRPFSEIALSDYQYYGVSPFDVKATMDEMHADVAFDARLSDNLDPLRPYAMELFIFEPHAKTPCHLLYDDGCKGHGSVVKNIECAHEPEGFLLYVKGWNPGERNEPPLVPCVWDVNLDPADYARIEKLERIDALERSFARSIFPIRQMWGNSNWKKFLPLEDVRDGVREEIQQKLTATLTSYDDPANRFWEGKIMETTRGYADAMGFELAGL